MLNSWSPSSSQNTTTSASNTSVSSGTAPLRKRGKRNAGRGARVSTLILVPSVYELGGAPAAIRPGGDRNRTQDRQADEPLVPIGGDADQHQTVLKDCEQCD